MPRWIRSTSTRFIALVFLLQIAATAGILFYVHQASVRALEGEQKALVGELRSDLIADYQEDGEAELVKMINTRLDSIRSDIPVILLMSAKGQVIAGNLAAWPTVIPYQTDWRTLDLYRMGGARAEHIGLITSTLPGGAHLLTGHVIEGNLALTRINERAMVAAFLFAVPFALLIALLLGRMINGRLRGIAATAEAVGHGNFSRRVPMNGSGDAFDALGHGVNAMLDKIEGLIGELRIITDGLAHDLRSPITRLKSVVERACFEVKDPVALTAIERVSTEADTLLAMLTTALQISRAEAGIGRDRFVSVDVKALLDDLVEVYGPVAEDQGFALTCDVPQGLAATLHRELISQALGNLIENALKYGEGGKTISLSAAREGQHLRLTVADDGPGIPAERRDEALRRFGRLDPSRHITGSGLGLSLVEAVARLHGGEVVLVDNAPGLRVVVGVLLGAGV
jgi:signal transduction histidine kinase